MAGIAPLMAHLVKTSYNERSQPSKTWNGGRHITGSAICSTHAVTTVPIESCSPPLDFLCALANDKGQDISENKGGEH